MGKEEDIKRVIKLITWWVAEIKDFRLPCSKILQLSGRIFLPQRSQRAQREDFFTSVSSVSSVAKSFWFRLVRAVHIEKRR